MTQRLLCSDGSIAFLHGSCREVFPQECFYSESATAPEGAIDSGRETFGFLARATQCYGRQMAGPRPAPRRDSAPGPSQLEVFAFGRTPRVRTRRSPPCGGNLPTPGRPPWPYNLLRPCVVGRHEQHPQSGPPARDTTRRARPIQSAQREAAHQIAGVSPTKVRKVPQDSCQLPWRKGFSAIPELPRRDLV